ncbi:alpha/beta hydrolase [Streptomyces aidingensis]|uniref:TAP-like protein n=1 Tax=Streptomyces aidingensis TaxID=910347 RepID=A0A1I1EWX5_9ACTN|nr:alpha/beta hydrolase [Streptomyces aidingensis]SFB91594.1 TAP-like protein [Streptomyces aidingensis]
MRPARNRTARTVLAAAVAGAVLLTACTDGGDGGEGNPAADAAEQAGPTANADPPGEGTDTADLPQSLTGQRPEWSECGAPSPEQGADAPAPGTLPDGTAWECATLEVPLDYTDPGGETIGIAMIRARAAEEGGERIGSLLFNFGGPGGSGVITLPAFAEEYATLRERYDLVSFDPRGVGGSSGVKCLGDERLDDYFAAEPVPDSEAEERELLSRIERFADGCGTGYPGLLPHLTTTNTARDMDLMREVLGDDRLHYFGISYGTLLGGVYAHLFPDRVGRALLDAVVDPTRTDAESALGQAGGFQTALEAYLEDCAQDDNCPLGTDPEEGEQRLTGLLDTLEKDPMPTQNPERPLTEALAWSGIAQSLYSQDFWPFLTQGLEDALDPDDPDGTILLALGDAMNGRAADGTYSTLQSAFLAINCADSSLRYDTGDVTGRLAEFRAASPVFGPVLAWSMLSCTGWPVDGQRPHPEVAAEGSAPILLMGTTGDPATPYEGTERMRDALGEDVAVVLTYEGEGHGAYSSGNACVLDAANAYLLEGTVPEPGLTCG